MARDRMKAIVPMSLAEQIGVTEDINGEICRPSSGAGREAPRQQPFYQDNYS